MKITPNLQQNMMPQAKKPFPAKINKLKIMSGVYWIEIPEAQLRILCGCPEDSVKHMMRRGMIASVEENDTSYETGPNAILLSDVLIQNGKFSNLAEFPVLQMLYRQGMILPNHRNNTGDKPILIGTAEQVNAQMRYIYEGNYGITEEEDLIKTGISPEFAQTIMQLKLKFAFGQISPSEDFIDSCIVTHEKREIRNGVFIERKNLNVYAIEYENEAVTVDLNLPHNQTYHPPYHLSFHNIRREYFAVLHIGDGDGWDIFRPCMSSILMFQGKIYLIDAGPNILHSLDALGIGISEVEGIFHTHAHDDHFAGLTALVLNDYKLKYYTTPLVREAVFRKFAALTSIDQERLYQYFDLHDLALDEWNDISGLEVKPIFSPHPVETNIFFFQALSKTGYQSYAHFADIVSLEVLKEMIREDKSQPGISQEYFEEVRKNYLTPATIKKIDIGGGLIHGNALDFRDDPSEKIMLSHTAVALTENQKMIGSGASFGMIDVFIHTHQDYAMRRAYQHLQSYFPQAPHYQISSLLNNTVITFNPETIVLKKGARCHCIFLVLGGIIEQIEPMLGIYNTLNSGALIGDVTGLQEMPSVETYRAKSFVQALEIPRDMFNEFVQKTGVSEEIEKFQESREFLLASAVFGSLSYALQNRIIKSMSICEYKAGFTFPHQVQSHISLLTQGSIELSADNKSIETLTVGDSFGQEGVLFQRVSPLKMRTKEKTKVFQFPGSLIQDIPRCLWKLHELDEKRQRLLKQGWFGQWVG